MLALSVYSPLGEAVKAVIFWGGIFQRGGGGVSLSKPLKRDKVWKIPILFSSLTASLTCVLLPSVLHSPPAIY